MDYKLLQLCNKEIKTIDVKGKQYAEVNQRIKVFRMMFPEGSIETEIIKMQDGLCVMKATIKDEFERTLAVGHAYEKEDSTFINKTSYLENCETSAVGRALGMLGIGIDTSVASAEEVMNAINQQSKNQKIDAAHVKTLEACIIKHGQTIERTCEVFKVQSLSDLTMANFTYLMDKMGER